AHTVAHGADLLGVLSSSRHLQALHQGVLLDVIAERLVAPTPTVLVDGEDDRLAYAALSIVHRNLVDAEQLDEWVSTLAAALARPRGHLTDHTWPTPAAKNTSAFLRALHVHLAIGIAPSHDKVSFADPPEARSDLLLALLRAIPTFTPWMYSGRRVADAS
ncbi:MAG: DUF2785 domain-containing protein, partial [Nocardioidaceae bacterium]